MALGFGLIKLTSCVLESNQIIIANETIITIQKIILRVKLTLLKPALPNNQSANQFKKRSKNPGPAFMFCLYFNFESSKTNSCFSLLGAITFISELSIFITGIVQLSFKIKTTGVFLLNTFIVINTKQIKYMREILILLNLIYFIDNVSAFFFLL